MRRNRHSPIPIGIGVLKTKDISSLFAGIPPRKVFLYPEERRVFKFIQIHTAALLPGFTPVILFLQFVLESLKSRLLPNCERDGVLVGNCSKESTLAS